ncbi:hypothetical protein EPK99_00800 [Neorhizobium lilium]|uniref:Uncharacterized protein n=1 Tax=Neorhizobium lilium TaxID=2503024 RepID=A0A444LKS3_9HYPH|nr:hypothetical protein [Neorhizobium lilium]RWX80912.1 hypothetical protein EPK99_00800 [Neorhizobium lilium]
MGSAFAPVRYTMVEGNLIIIVGGNDGTHPVQVTQDALSSVLPTPSHDPNSYAASIDIMVRIAEKKITNRETAFDGRVWITANDVRAWRACAAK